MASGERASMARHQSESAAAARLQAAFERVRNPMLLVDDQRWYVTANGPACGLLGIEPDEVPWRRIDDFTPAADRRVARPAMGGVPGQRSARGLVPHASADRQRAPGRVQRDRQRAARTSPVGRHAPDRHDPGPPRPGARASRRRGDAAPRARVGARRGAPLQAGPAHGPRARGARARGRGAQGRRDRAAAGGVPGDDQVARPERDDEARRAHPCPRRRDRADDRADRRPAAGPGRPKRVAARLPLPDSPLPRAAALR